MIYPDYDVYTLNTYLCSWESTFWMQCIGETWGRAKNQSIKLLPVTSSCFCHIVSELLSCFC